MNDNVYIVTVMVERTNAIVLLAHIHIIDERHMGISTVTFFTRSCKYRFQELLKAYVKVLLHVTYIPGDFVQ